MLRFLYFLLLLMIVQVAAKNYIIALRQPATKRVYEQARKDVESMGGKVTHEFHASLKAILASLPSQKIHTLSTKPYVEFVEEDKSVHI